MCVSQRELQTARDDADYYRTQAETLRQREHDRTDQLRREAKDAMRRGQPSNRLYHGDVTDFSDAVNCHITACQHEIEIPRPDDDEDMRRTIERCNTTMTESITRAKQARHIYDQITAETRTRIAEALKNASLTDWAECLETGDYSPMAI